MALLVAPFLSLLGFLMICLSAWGLGLLEKAVYYLPLIGAAFLSGLFDPGALAAPGQSGFWGTSGWAALGIAGFLLVCCSWLIVSFLRPNASPQKALTGGGGKWRSDIGPVAEIPDVQFGDVAGCPEVIEEVSELSQFLKDPTLFNELGANMPSGVLLHGPPGTGKTLVARALAGESNVPFFAVSGSQFVEMYVGVGAKRVRELFAAARDCPKGAVIFIDELDAIGAQRSEQGSVINRESDQTLNQLLTEMDGFQGNENIIIVAATNRLDMLDEALLRPGRFSRHVEVPLPDRPGRDKILSLHARSRKLAKDVDLKGLAIMTAGVSGAQLAETLNEAAIWAARQGHSEIHNEDMIEGLCRVVAGYKRIGSPDVQEQLETIAVHEAGHALCAELCIKHDVTQYLTVQPRGRALGFALQGKTDRALLDEHELHQRLVVILGGRAAEYITLGRVSSGAAGDLQQASELARRAIEEWGLSPAVGQISGAGVQLSGRTKDRSDTEVARMVEEAYHDAVDLLKQNQQLLTVLSDRLLSEETLARPEIEHILADAEKVDLAPRYLHRPSLDPRRAEPRRGNLSGS